MDKKRWVLFVDDEADFLASVAFWLEAKGYAVTTALSGKQAIDLIKRQPFDMVFLDMHMPQMSGLETLRQIRTFNKEIPVVIVTVDYEEEARLEKEKAPLGISGFFLKQSSLDRLGWALEMILRMRGTTSAADEQGTP